MNSGACPVREKVYRHDQILQALRRSAKGEATNIMMRLVHLLTTS